MKVSGSDNFSLNCLTLFERYPLKIIQIDEYNNFLINEFD
jgi:hypothetical protein